MTDGHGRLLVMAMPCCQQGSLPTGPAQLELMWLPLTGVKSGLPMAGRHCCQMLHRMERMGACCCGE